MPVHRLPQVRQIESSEDAVPVGTVALRALDLAPRLLVLLAGQTGAAEGLDARAQLRHAPVQAPRLGIAGQELAPGPGGDAPRQIRLSLPVEPALLLLDPHLGL